MPTHLPSFCEILREILVAITILVLVGATAFLRLFGMLLVRPFPATILRIII